MQSGDKHGNGPSSNRYWLPKQRRGSLQATVVKTVAVFAVLIAVWWVVSAWLAKPLILPTPPQVFGRLAEMVQTTDFWLSVLLTLLRVIGGFVIGMVLGTLFAFLMYRIEALHVVFAPLIRIIQATPIVSFILIALIWIDTGILPLVISGLMVFPVAWSNVAAGLRDIDPAILEMASVFHIPRLRMLRKVFLPALRPQFNASIVSGVGLAWKSGITAEVLALPLYAIGHGIYSAKIYLETPDLFAWTIVVVALSFALEALCKAVLRHRVRVVDERLSGQGGGHVS